MNVRLMPAILAVAMMLAGCAAVGPDYVRPAVPTPVAFKESAGWKLAQPADTEPRGPWWRIFDDPELDALVAQVAIGNQDVKAAEAQYRQALALLDAARAGLVPTITGNASASRAATRDQLIRAKPWSVTNTYSRFDGSELGSRCLGTDPPRHRER